VSRRAIKRNASYEQVDEDERDAKRNADE